MNNRWTFYGDSEELYHYGVLGMRWGVHKARYYQRKGNKYRRMASVPGENSAAYKAKAAEYERKYESAKKHLVTKSTEKLRSFSNRYTKEQNQADRRYSTAQRKDRSWLSSQESADKAYDKASKAQYKANKDAYKGKKWYEQMVRAYGDLDITMDKETIEIGKDLVDRVAAQSISIYSNSRKR